MSDGWDESAHAWIVSQGVAGDWGRRFVLDPPMLARVAGRGFADAIDIGCGEGRFCRMLQPLGIRTLGIDPTVALIDRARLLDPRGDYRIGRAESLDAPEGAFDLAVCYLSLIDIPDLASAIAEIARVLRPGGTLLIANLQSFATAEGGDYFEERAEWVAWQHIRVHNWHRPLSSTMSPLFDAGFTLRHFAEPEPSGSDDAAKTARYRRMPHFLVMEWQKTA